MVVAVAVGGASGVVVASTTATTITARQANASHPAILVVRVAPFGVGVSIAVDASTVRREPGDDPGSRLKQYRRHPATYLCSV